MMKTSDEILKLVNDFLASLPYERKPKSLYDPVEYVLSIGGKRIRPVLMLMGYNLWREDPASILMPAVGLETYHNYTLLHDDLMDNADVRRGHETVHRRWDANKAILISVCNRCRRISCRLCWTSLLRPHWRLARVRSTT